MQYLDRWAAIYVQRTFSKPTGASAKSRFFESLFGGWRRLPTSVARTVLLSFRRPPAIGMSCNRGCCLRNLRLGAPVSRAVNGTEVRLVNDHHAPVAMGEIGELVLRSPNVNHRLLGRTRIARGCNQRWLVLYGDLMRQDEKGNLWFVSRKKYLIIRGGSNISPIEVEQVLTSHPAVQDAALIGVPDPELGERVAGFIQLRCTDPQSVNRKDIRCYLAGRLADYKIPEQLKIVSAIPRNALGKIDRKALNSLYSN